ATAISVLVGCTGGALPPDHARAAIVAAVPGGTLTGATLERWLLRVPEPPSTVNATVLVSTWINTALAIEAFRSNRSLDDSATTDAAIRPDADRGASVQYFAERDAKRAPISDAEADSLSDVDNVRVFQQILLRLSPQADSVTRVAAITRARALEQRARAGANFAGLAVEASPDSATRRTGGVLPAITHDQIGRLPDRMQQIWALKPGDISDLIGSPVGIHIMRRVTRAEARPALKSYLAPILARRSDSLFIDSVTATRHIVVAADARPRVRALAMEPVTALDSTPMATWRGGTLSPVRVRSATLMLDPGARVRLSNASDSVITRYLADLAKRAIVLDVIAPGPSPGVEARRTLGPAYRDAVAAVRTSLGRVPASVSSADAATQYLDSALAGERSLPLPGALSEVLRSGAKVRVDAVVLQSVLRVAAPEWRVRHANDSTTAARADAARERARPAASPPK
ncbi:MAG: peptidylprolyl isomerase, partial [Gemmatimonadales bacterium]